MERICITFTSYLMKPERGMAVPLTFGFVISDVISVLLKYPASKKTSIFEPLALNPPLNPKSGPMGHNGSYVKYVFSRSQRDSERLLCSFWCVTLPNILKLLLRRLWLEFHASRLALYFHQRTHHQKKRRP